MGLPDDFTAVPWHEDVGLLAGPRAAAALSPADSATEWVPVEPNPPVESPSLLGTLAKLGIMMSIPLRTASFAAGSAFCDNRHSATYTCSHRTEQQAVGGQKMCIKKGLCQTSSQTCNMILSGVGKALKKWATHRKANGFAILSCFSVHLHTQVQRGCGLEQTLIMACYSRSPPKLNYILLVF